MRQFTERFLHVGLQQEYTQVGIRILPFSEWKVQIAFQIDGGYQLAEVGRISVNLVSAALMERPWHDSVLSPPLLAFPQFVGTA